MTSASFSPAALSDVVVKTLQTTSHLRQQLRSATATRTKSPLLSVQSFPLLMCIIVPGQAVFELDSLALGSSAADLLLHPALPLSLPVFPPPAARKAICGGLQWEEVGTVLRWAWNKGLQTSRAALLTSRQRQKIVLKTKNITIRFDLGQNVSM